MQRFETVVELHSNLLFQWDVSDCFVFPADVVLALTGVELFPEQRGYKNEMGAAKRMLALGFKNVGDVFAAELMEIAPASMTLGDIGVAEQDGRVCGVVCLGLNLMGKSTAGMTILPRSSATRAFKV